MEEGFADRSSGGVIAAGIFAGAFVIGLMVIGVKMYNYTPDNQPLPPTQGGKRRTRRFRPRRGTRRV